MTDYISREAAIDDICSRLNWSDLEGNPIPQKDIRAYIADLINHVPAADVRPVVFCKDCVHFVRGELFGDMVCDYHYRHQYHAEPYEFCSHAEKREES